MQEELKRAGIKAQYDLDLERKERRRADEECHAVQEVMRGIKAKYQESERARTEVRPRSCTLKP